LEEENPWKTAIKMKRMRRRRKCNTDGGVGSSSGGSDGLMSIFLSISSTTQQGVDEFSGNFWAGYLGRSSINE